MLDQRPARAAGFARERRNAAISMDKEGVCIASAMLTHHILPAHFFVID
jgi:hypothetical protein